MTAPWAAGSSDGELKIDFSVPVAALSFDAGLTTSEPLTNGLQVRLFNGLQMLDTIAVPTTYYNPGPFRFSEAEFTYVSPGLPVTSIAVTFSPMLNFAFDNLSYSTVPEPATTTLLSLLLLISAGRRLQR